MTTDILLSLTARVTMLIAVAWGVTLVARRGSASLRHLVWIAALAGSLAVPLAPRLIPAREVPVPDVVAPLFVQTTATAVVAQSTTDWTSVALWIWLAGAILVVLRLIAGIVQVALIARAATPLNPERIARVAARLGLNPIEVKVSPVIPTAFTFGIWKPAILMPSAALDWTEERFDAVLAHEMMHVRRRDCLTQIPAQLATAFYWFHPLVWIAEARSRQERERACDDGVLSLGFEPSDYAVHLLELARGFGSPASWPAAVAMARPSELEGRLVSILNPLQSRRRVARWQGVMASLAAAALIWPVATMRAPAQTGDSGRIKGVVRDASGAVIPKAFLTLSNNVITERTSSNEAGEYDFRILPPGSYTLDVAVPGFARAYQQVEVAANQVVRQEITLNLGAVSEKLTVSVAPEPSPSPQPSPQPTRVRVGGNVQACKLIYQTKPVYPDRLRESKISGKAVLQAVILMDGSVGGLKILESLGDPEFGRAAENAVRLWRYEPARLNGQPVEVVTNIAIDFLAQ